MLSIFGEGEGAGVDEERVAIALLADDGGEDGERDLLLRARADGRLKQIAKHVDATAQLGDAAQMGRVKRGGRGTDADDRTGQAGCAQALGGAYHGGAFGFGGVSVLGEAATGIGMTAVCADAAEFGAGPGVQGRGEGEERGIFGCEAAAVFAAIDLDQHGKTHAELGAGGGESGAGGGVIAREHEVCARAEEGGGAGEFAGLDGDGVEEVVMAVCKKILGLVQRGDSESGERLAGGGERGDLGAFGGFQMWPQRHAECGRAGGQPVEVGREDAAIQEKNRGGQRGERGRHVPQEAGGRTGAQRESWLARGWVWADIGRR